MPYRVEQLTFISSGALLRIAAMATVGFALMTLFTWHGRPGLTIVCGALIVGVLLTVAVWYWFQERYPTATLFAERPLEASSPFHGYVETDERTLENRSVRLELVNRPGARGGSILLFRQRVPREQIRKSKGDRVHIPFSCPPPGPVGKTVVLRVRTPFFPFGWGVTFDVSPPE